MKILYLTSRFPYPPLKGDQLRDLKQIELLSKSHNITLVSFYYPGTTQDQFDYIKQWCQLVAVPWGRREGYYNLCMSLFSRHPFQVNLFMSHVMRNKINTLLDNNSYDIIHVHLARMTEYVKHITNIPKVADLMDAFSLNMKNRSKRDRFPYNFVSKLEAKRMEQYERYICKIYDKIIVVSERDKYSLQNLENVAVIPLGVDINENLQANFEGSGIIFTGNMGYFPNQDAAYWFATEIFPLVLKEVPDSILYIVGNNPRNKILKLQSPQIVVTGYVDSIRKHISRATVAIAPLRAGSGMQIKVLEAMSVGCPVVATTYAAEGLNYAVSGKDLLLADCNPVDFAQKVVSVLKDKKLGKKISSSALELVRDNYSWKPCVKSLEEVYKAAITEFKYKGAQP